MSNNDENTTPTPASSSWASKEIQLDDAPSKIPNGSNVYIGSCAATADATLQTIVNDYHLENITIIQMIPGGNLPHLSKNLDRFRTMSFWSFTTVGYHVLSGKPGKSLEEGLEDYKPMSIHAIPRLLREGKLKVDVVICKVTPPHKGFVSLGMGVDATKDFIQHARVVIAEVNPQLPWTEGPSKIPCDQITHWIHQDEKLKTLDQLWPKLFDRGTYPPHVMDRIGHHVVSQLIPDRATLRFGITPLVHCVFPYLSMRKDLGLHTDIFTEELYELHEQGVITNKYKTIHRGRSIVSQCTSTTGKAYDFIDRNPVIEFHPMSHCCDPQVLGQMDNLVVVVGALKVDLTGQVATDSIAHRFFGGVWSDDDSIRGARFSKGGKPIVILTSRSLKGRSNVVFSLPPGTGVSITRADVEYVVTEYGVATLYGKSIRERCLAMIDIAHPDFRQELLQQAKQHSYISQSQPGRSFSVTYPSDLEDLHKTKTDKQVLVRPIKAMDEDNLRAFFHKLSDHSVYLRYFRKLRSMPQRILQKTADVDYGKDMAIVCLYPPNEYESHDIVAIAQWVSDPRDMTGLIPPEIAFQVRDDWQGEGLGTYLFQRLLDIARLRGVRKLKADVLLDNQGMNAIFRKSGVDFVKRSDFGVVAYTFDLGENGENEDTNNHPAPKQVKRLLSGTLPEDKESP